jgi:hypothetical protein
MKQFSAVLLVLVLVGCSAWPEDAKAVVFMTGTMRDIDGVLHWVNEVVAFSPWRTQAVGAHIRLPKTLPKIWRES